MNKTWKILVIVTIVAVIALGGIYLWQQSKSENSTQQVIPTDIDVEETVAQEVEKEISKTDLVTFNFQEKDISFQYPETWTVITLSDQKAGVALRSPQFKPIRSGNVEYSGEIYVNTIANLQNLSIEELFDTFNDTSRFWFSNYQHENINYNRLSGVKFPKFQESAQSNYRTEIYITCPGKIVSLSYLYGEDEYQNILENIANSISCNSN